MRRVVLRDDEGNFLGWVNLDTATEIASYRVSNGPYVHGRVLYHTPKNKLFVNDWNNSGMDVYRPVAGDKEVAEILACNDSAADVSSQYTTIMERFEL